MIRVTRTAYRTSWFRAGREVALAQALDYGGWIAIVPDDVFAPEYATRASASARVDRELAKERAA